MSLAKLQIILAFGASLLAPLACAADRDWKKELSDLRGFCSVSIESIVEQMTPTIKARMGPNQGLPKIRLVSDLRRFARSRVETKEIDISTGQCLEIHHISLALATSRQFPLDRGSLMRYAAYLQSKQDLVAKASPLAAEDIVVEYYPGWSGLRDHPIFEARLAKIYDETTSFLLSGLAWLILHEVSHIAQKDLPAHQISSSESVRQEVMADAFALQAIKENISEADMYRAALLPLLMMQRQIARLNGGAANPESHPAPDCRLFALIDSSDEFRRLAVDGAIMDSMIKAGIIKRKPEARLDGSLSKLELSDSRCQYDF